MNKLTLVASIGMAMALTACGGGGGNQAALVPVNNTAPAATTAQSLSAYTTIDFVAGGVTANSITNGSANIVNKNGFLFASETGLKNQSALVDYAGNFGTKTITKSGVYSPDTTGTADGYRVAKVIASDDSNVTYVPYSAAGFTDLQKVRSVKWFDLSGKPVSTDTAVYWQEVFANPTLAADYPTNIDGSAQHANNAAMANFIAAAKAAVYPQGSACFKIQGDSAATGVNYITYTDTNPQVGNTQTWYNAYVSGHSDNTTKPTLDTWANNTAVAWENSGTSTNTGIVQGSSGYFVGKFTPNFDLPTASNDAGVAAYNLGTGKDGQQALASYHSLALQCDGYNATAATAIEGLIATATK